MYKWQIIILLSEFTLCFEDFASSVFPYAWPYIKLVQPAVDVEHFALIQRISMQALLNICPTPLNPLKIV